MDVVAKRSPTLLVPYLVGRCVLGFCTQTASDTAAFARSGRCPLSLSHEFYNGTERSSLPIAHLGGSNCKCFSRQLHYFPFQQLLPLSYFTCRYRNRVDQTLLCLTRFIENVSNIYISK
jgi:hypothetical protein